MSLMGIWGPKIAFSGPPVPVLAKVMVPIFVRTDVGNPIRSISILITGPTKSGEIMRVDFPPTEPPPANDGSKFYISNFFIQINNFTLDKAGVVEVIATVNGVEHLAGRLHVDVIDPSQMPQFGIELSPIPQQ